jgi:ABC-type uncharacterized transport system substrate-binding protein
MAESHNVLFVLSNSETLYTNFTDKTRQRLTENPDAESITVTRYILKKKIDPESLSRLLSSSKLVVTVGTRAAKILMQQQISQPVFFTMITKKTFEKIRSQTVIAETNPDKISALFIDHAPYQHIALIKAALPETKKIGIFIYQHNQDLLEKFSNSRKYYGISITPILVKGPRDVLRKLPDALSRIDILLSLPDNRIFDKKSLRHILISTFRHKKPIAGYSSAFVKAGAVLALFTTPDDHSRQAAEVIYSSLQKNDIRLPPPAQSKYFTIDVNYWVAQSLQLDIPSVREIRKRLDDLTR